MCCDVTQEGGVHNSCCLYRWFSWLIYFKIASWPKYIITVFVLFCGYFRPQIIRLGSEGKHFLVFTNSPEACIIFCVLILTLGHRLTLICWMHCMLQNLDIALKKLTICNNSALSCSHASRCYRYIQPDVQPVTYWITKLHFYCSIVLETVPTAVIFLQWMRWCMLTVYHMESNVTFWGVLLLEVDSCDVELVNWGFLFLIWYHGWKIMKVTCIHYFHAFSI